MIGIARETASLLEARGYTVTLINARFIKPLDDECIRRHAARSRVVCTFEDHSISGGFNSAVLESLETGDVKTPVEAIAWPDQFIEHVRNHPQKKIWTHSGSRATKNHYPPELLICL